MSLAIPKLDGRAYAQLAALLVVIGLVFWAIQSGVHERLELDVLRATVAGWGWWGGLLFVAMICVLQPLHVSSHLFVVTAALVWPPAWAMLLCWIGLMGSSGICFLSARFLFAEQVQARLPERFRAFEERIERNAFRSTLVMRLMFFSTPMIQFGFGVTKVRFKTYMAAVAIGTVPYVIAEVLLADQVAARLL